MSQLIGPLSDNEDFVRLYYLAGLFICVGCHVLVDCKMARLE